MTRAPIALLAGTEEARLAAAALRLQGRRVIASLAGATRAPLKLCVATRIGGFGGVDGLTKWLRAADICALLDATHPFATEISANATSAAAAAGCPALALRRPPWQRGPNDVWHVVPDVERAVDALPAGARAFLALGSGGHAPFLRRNDVALTLRALAKPPGLPSHINLLEAPPAQSIVEEVETLQRLSITHLVARNAGGRGGRAKIDAARSLGLPVIMIDLPPPPAMPSVPTVEGALAWLSATIDGA
ncbi:MAG: precorrin-6A/cobalt-precorrin-6A reductase [Pseudomonadota bacterium]